MPAPSGYTTVTVARTGISSYTNIGHVIRVNAAPFAWLHMVSDEKNSIRTSEYIMVSRTRSSVDFHEKNLPLLTTPAYFVKNLVSDLGDKLPLIA